MYILKSKREREIAVEVPNRPRSNNPRTRQNSQWLWPSWPSCEFPSSCTTSRMAPWGSRTLCIFAAALFFGVWCRLLAKSISSSEIIDAGIERWSKLRKLVKDGKYQRKLLVSFHWWNGWPCQQHTWWDHSTCRLKRPACMCVSCMPLLYYVYFFFCFNL